MDKLALVLLAFAFVCFVLACFQIGAEANYKRLIAAGLAFFVAAELFGGVQHILLK